MFFSITVSRSAAIALAFVFTLPAFGGPFPEDTDKLIVRTLGVPVTLSELQKTYSDILPLGSIEVRPSKMLNPNFKIVLKNSAGLNVGDVDMRFRRHRGAPSIVIETVFLLDRNLRGYGLSSRLLDATVKLLQSVTNDKNAAIFLHAWTGNSLFGGYVWAPYGFEYADKTKGLQLNRKFGSWVEKTYGAGRLLIDRELQEVKGSTEKWRYPWEMALFDATTVIGRPVGKFNGRLGKEFMGASEERVAWNGVLYVNRENGPGMKQFRAYSAVVMERSCAAFLAANLKNHRIEKSLNK